MASYVGPARLLLDGHVHHVAVNLHAFVDLSSAPSSRWRGVVVDAAFRPSRSAESTALVELPDGRSAPATIADRRLEGDGDDLFG